MLIRRFADISSVWRDQLSGRTPFGKFNWYEGIGGGVVFAKYDLKSNLSYHPELNTLRNDILFDGTSQHKSLIFFFNVLLNRFPWNDIFLPLGFLQNQPDG